MSKPDLEGIIPKSNADTSSDDTDDEYEIVSDTSDDDYKPQKGDKHGKGSCKEKKYKRSKHTEGPHVRTKRTKLPSRDAKVGSDALPPLQTSNPAQHAIEPPKPIIVKQAIDNQFDKAFQIDLTHDTQRGIAYQPAPQQLRLPPPPPVQERFGESIYKHKYFPLIIVIIIAIACMVGTWWYYKRKFQTGYDPIKATLTGGDKEEDEKEEKEEHTLNSLTGSASGPRLPASYEDSFNYNDDSSADEVVKDIKSIPKSANKGNNKPQPKSANKGNSKSAVQRDAHGRFVKK